MSIPGLREKVLREASRAAKAWTTNSIDGKELARAMYRLNEAVEQLEAAYAKNNGQPQERATVTDFFGNPIREQGL